ncbi:MAG: hypothetical protein Q8P95_04360 [bacterium]|nr:hypothetical protein [bacterium]
MFPFSRKKDPKILRRQKWALEHRREPRLRLRQFLRSKWWLVLLILISFSGVIYAAFFTPLLLIQSVQVGSDYKDVNVGKLQRRIETELLGKSLTSVNLSQLEADVYEQNIDVASLLCRRDFLNRAVACNAIGYELVAVIKSRGMKYYINENGVVIDYDSRKLGLPIFDLILNPIYNEGLGVVEKELPLEEASVVEQAPPTLTEQVLKSRLEGLSQAKPEQSALEEIIVPEEGDFGFRLHTFIEKGAVTIEGQEIKQQEGFQVVVGEKILDPAELKVILTSIERLEEVLGRKVSRAQYVQVAGELAISSQTTVGSAETPGIGGGKDLGGEEVEVEAFAALPAHLRTPQNNLTRLDEQERQAGHEVTVLLWLRGNLDQQFTKLRKLKEVVNFDEIQRIDLSIEGEKVFYR